MSNFLKSHSVTIYFILTLIILSSPLTIPLLSHQANAASQPSPTQHLAEDGTNISYSNPDSITLVLTSITSSGYRFKASDGSGAFIPTSEAHTYHVSSLKPNNIVTMVFNAEGDILKVNGQLVPRK